MEDPAHPVFPKRDDGRDDAHSVDAPMALTRPEAPPPAPQASDEVEDVEFPPLAPDEVLIEVVDDHTDASEAVLWASSRLISGETVEAVAAQLMQSGWSTDRAEELAETARLRTRHERGVVSREEVAAQQARKYAAAGGFTFFTILNPMRTLSATYQLLLRFFRWRYGSRRHSDAE